MTVGAFTNSNISSCANPVFYSITSSISGFVVAVDAINFNIVVANRGQNLMKQSETLILTISGAEITTFAKTFVYNLYDCSQTTETSKTINWIIDPAPTSRTITLANTAGMLYTEYCTPYLFTLTKSGASVSLPAWMTFTNSTPITSDATGPSITIGTNQISEAGSYVLKKELMNAGN